MSRRRFEQVEELFHRLSELPPEERDAVLDGLADADLAAEVRALLAADDGDTEQESRGLLPDLLLPDDDDELGLADRGRIGPYQITRRLGAGGMGTVYLAHQSEPVERDVALKVVRWGLASRGARARFSYERQVLAVMEHPNIARVYDAGTLDDGRPYFAMEYVQGQAITSFCDAHRLSTRERLRLFIDACSAVQHAHRKAVLHRDLKPSNILVAEIDGRPLVKVIDFGVAKPTGEPLHDRPLETRLGELVGTPEYMSPEQAALAAVDTRTDVYSLGVVLFELLVGELPIPAESLRRATLDEIRRTLRDTATPAPSSKLQARNATVDEAAHRRRTDPASLRQSLRGELDWIALRALAKDPEERYDSPLALAEDLERHLRGEPVLAGPPGWLYRTRKLVMRHRAAFLAASLALVALFTATVISTLGLVRARRAEAKAASALAQSEQRERTAKEVTEFLVDLFGGADPVEAERSDPTVRELLDRGVEDVQSLDEEPAIQAELLHTMGRVYTNLGSYERARTLLERSLALRRASAGEAQADLDTALTLERLGMLYNRLNELEKARDAHAAALDIRERLLPPDHPHVSMALNNLAIVESKLGEHVAARGLLERSLRIAESSDSVDSKEAASVRLNLAVEYALSGRHERAAEAYERVLEVFERELGPKHPNVGLVLNNLAYSLRAQGRHSSALETQLRSIAIERDSLGSNHPVVGEDLLNVSHSYVALGRTEEARRALDEAREILIAKLGPRHERVEQVYRQLAMASLQDGDLEATEGWLERARELAAPLAGERGASTRLRVEAELARVERLRGDFGAAESRCRTALAQVPPGAIELSPLCQLQLALIALETGDGQRASRLHAEAEAQLDAGPRGVADDPTGPISRAAYAAAAGDLDEAYRLLDLALDQRSVGSWTLENPDLEPLHADSRFADFARRLRERLAR